MSPRSVRGRDGEYKLSPEVFRPVAEDGPQFPVWAVKRQAQREVDTVLGKD